MDKNSGCGYRMPLPKTATIAARATEVYCEVWSVILQRISKMPPTRESDLDDLSQLLPYLRQLLTCCACAGLLDNAMISLTCGHCYCFDCQFREPLLKIQCRQCRERTGLVMENQLQLVVNCYKRMCQILGEELRKNPSALDVTPDKEDPGVVPAAMATKLSISIKVPNEEQCGKVGIVSEEETNISSKKTAVTVEDTKKTLMVTVEDPIGEIVREVEKGTKVSRAILWIKPPHKYINNKAPVSHRVVTKKEASAPVSTDDPGGAKPDSATSVVSDGGQGGTVTEALEGSMDPEGNTSSVGSATSIDPERPATSAGPVTGPSTRKRKRKFARVQARPKIRKRNTVLKEEHVTTVIANAKRKLRKPTAASTLSHQRNQSTIARRKRAASRTERKESSSSKSQVLQASDTEKKVAVVTKKPADNGREKKPAVNNREKKPADNSREKKPADNNRKNKPATATTDAPKVDTVSPPTKQGPLNFLYGGEMKVSGLSISVHCFDNEYLKTSSRSLALLPHAQPANVLSGAMSSPSTPPGAPKKTSYAGGEWLKLTHQRKWDLLCPSVVARRSMVIVARTHLIMCKAAKSKKKLRYHKSKQRRTILQNLKKAVKPESPKPGHPPPPTAAFRPRPVLVPSPFPLSRPPTGDIPLPENIPLLPSEGILEDDINWKQLSDFLESNDEESLSALPPPISRYGPPPCSQQQPRPQPINPVPFDDQRYGPRQLMHPPQFMPHHPHHPHPQHPSHIHIPPPHLPLPPPGPHTPMMSPFTPDMRTPAPDGFFTPMMGPEDFLPPGGGMGPDGGGYSSPMTPHRGYPPPPPPPQGVLCPMEFPGHHRHHHHHHPGGHFQMPNPMPSPRMTFPPTPPPRRSYPGPSPIPRPPPKKSKSSNAGGSGTATMSKMVSKMKIKSPTGGQKQKKLLSSPATPTPTLTLTPTPTPTPTKDGDQPLPGKKRRSPGYSEAGWRCRCGTNNVMFPDKVCAKGKCPCYTKGVACKNCLCRHCHNPFGTREVSASLPADAVVSE